MHNVAHILTGVCYATAVSVTSMLVQLYAADGVAAFFKGFSPALSRTMVEADFMQLSPPRLVASWHEHAGSVQPRSCL